MTQSIYYPEKQAVGLMMVKQDDLIKTSFWLSQRGDFSYRYAGNCLYRSQFASWGRELAAYCSSFLDTYSGLGIYQAELHQYAIT